MFMTNALLNAGAARLSLSTQSARDETRRAIITVLFIISTMTVEYYLVLNAELQQSALKICKVSAPLGRTPMCAFE